MIGVIKKYKKFLIDLIVNTFSFGIYIIAQQVILMPIMGKWLPETDFSKLVIYISVFSIISNTLGSELGITRQVKGNEDDGKVYNQMLLKLMPIIVCISYIILRILKYSIINSIALTIIILFANIRLYCAAYYRFKKNFKNVLVLNVLYLIGMVIGIFIFKGTNLIWVPMLLAEFSALPFYLFTSDILKNKKSKSVKNKKNIYKAFYNFSLISFLVNGMVYFDKFLLYPMLGSTAVSIYFATTSMSKIISLITNPLHGVLLSWINPTDKTQRDKLVSKTIKINIPITIVLFIISIPITYLAIMILYNQYLEEAKQLIIPTCIGISFATVASLVKALLLKFVEPQKITASYIIYYLIFAVTTLSMSKIWGLNGFVWANTISKIFLWIEFLYLLKIIIKKDERSKFNEKNN